MNHAAIVVPCYNEASRLDLAAFRAYLSQSHGVRFVFVNDGSRDGTLEILRRLQAEFPDVDVLDKQPNAGKADAVRVGMLRALELPGTDFTGFWDADLATPLDAIDDLLAIFDQKPAVEMVMGSRVKLLGRQVERRAVRHYLGRVFATFASLALELAVYDTQCGAKLFRASPFLRSVLEKPFCSKWIFDVEIIARLSRAWRERGADPEEKIYEYPLLCWRDVPGSKLKSTDFARAILELYRIRRESRR